MPFDGLRRVFRLERGPRSADADVDLELEHHFAAATDDLVRRGIPPREARRLVAERFGNVRATRQALVALSRSRARSRRWFAWRTDWWLDARHALRALVSAPGVSIATVTILALGIGANTAMYGILEKLFLQPPPHITAPDEIVRLYFRERSDFTGGQEITHGRVDFEQYLALARDVSGFAALAGYWHTRDNLGRGQQAEPVVVGTVIGTFFALLGVQPVRGRFLEPADDSPTATPAAVISHGYWHRRFGGSDAALGTTIALDRVTYTVVGVAPRGFSGPDASAADLWIPAQIAGPAGNGPNWRQRRYGGLSLRLLARLHPGVRPAVVAEQAARALLALDEGAPLPGRTAGVARTSEVRVLIGPIMAAQGPEGVSQNLRLSLVVGGVALILLVIACANVTNLLALRAAARRRELAVRSALGAGRWRVARLLVLESVGLALAAGVAAAAVAALAGQVLRVVLLPNFNWATSVLDLRVLGFAGLLALAIGLITGLVPAMQVARGAGVDDLRAGTRAARRANTPVRAGLLVLQGALALVLVVGAGVFYRSFERARGEDLGFDLEHLLVATLNHVDPGDRSPLSEDAISALEVRVRRLPGVREVAQATNSAMGSWSMVALRVRGIESLPRMRGPYVNGVTPNYFGAAGLSITQGRGFDEADREGASRVAVVNTTMVRALWPSGDPLGACLYVGGGGECTTVVGVVETEGTGVRDPEAFAQYYLPLAQLRGLVNRRSLLVRTQDDPSRLVSPTLGAMADLFPDLPRERVRALPDVFALQLRPWKVGMGLFAAAGSLALFLAAVGLYAVIAYTVRQREHEFGIRRALGAQVSDLVRLVMAQSVAFGALGTVLGAALAYWGARFVKPLLYQDVNPRDPSILIAASVVLLTACLVAGFFPARAAGLADPRAALQAE